MAETTQTTRISEPTIVDTSTFEIKGKDSGTVYGKGTNLGEALAKQQQMVGGSTPTVSGRPDLFATTPTAADDVKPFVDQETGQTITPKVATPQQLQQRAEGTLESFNSVRVLTQPASTNISAASEQPKYKPENFADAMRYAAQAGAEQRKDDLLGAPDSYDNQILRQKASLMDKLFGQNLTPDDLKWLTPAQSAAVLSGDEQLIKNQLASLNTIVQGRKDLRAEEEERANAQFQKYLDSDIDPSTVPPEFLSNLDARTGMPEGFHAAYLASDHAKDEAARKEASFNSAKAMYEFLQGLPVGETVTVDGIEYGSLNKGEIEIIKEDDGRGNLNIIRINKDTGEVLSTTQLEGVTSADSVFKEKNGVGLFINESSGEIRVAYDLNQPMAGAGAGNTIRSTFVSGEKPTGTTNGWCGEFVRELTGYTGPDISSIDAKEQLVSDYGFRVGENGVPEQTPRFGDTFVMNNVGSYGHVGVVLSATRLDDGSYQMDIVDSNWNGDGKVRYTQINSKSVYGFARLGVQQQYQSGTDGIDERAALERYGQEEEAEISIPQQADLRNQIAKDPAITQYQALSSTYDSMSAIAQTALNKPTNESRASLDQALVTLFNKMLDPTSVVREGEYARTAEGQSALSRAQGFVMQVQQGGAGITDGTREDMVEVARVLQGSAEKQYGESIEYWVPILEGYGLSPDMFIKGYGDAITSADALKQEYPEYSQVIDELINEGFDFNDILEALSL